MNNYSSGNQLRPVAATIVARNYIAFARTLCQSFLRQHPDGQFFVLLVDELEDELIPNKEPFELVELETLDLPGGDLFLYKYSILELSTAVKPFFMRYLLEKFSLESLLYLDPDLYLTAPLTAVYNALLHSSIVLTPHMFSPPPEDGHSPSERDIMLSGSFNLGFLGVKNNTDTINLMDWWSERLADNCIVDLPNAVFVDQRWMDMAPSYFGGVRILRDVSLNVAYWNLHERQLERSGDKFLVNAVPLTFFHFSGFNPLKSDVLSKHQSRHRLDDNEALSIIFQEYGKELINNEYQKLSKIPVAFNSLRNGVGLGKWAQWVVRRAIEKKINLPSPRYACEEFCRFLMTPNHLFDRRGIAPLLVALEQLRPDVKSAFPAAFESPEGSEDVEAWIRSSGKTEENLGALFQKFGNLLGRIGVSQRALQVWRSRNDLRTAFPSAFSGVAGSQAYANWIELHGTKEEGFESGDGELFLSHRPGLLKPLMLYLQDGNLQREFKFLFLEEDRSRYINWLLAEACPRNIVSSQDIAWFDGFAEGAPDTLAAIVFGHGSWLRANLVGGGTLFDLRQIRDLLQERGVPVTGRFLFKTYSHHLGCELLAQAEQFYRYTPDFAGKFPNLFGRGEAYKNFVDILIKQITKELSNFHGLESLGAELVEKQVKMAVSKRRTIKEWFGVAPRSSQNDSQTQAPPGISEEESETVLALKGVREYLLVRFADLELDGGGVNLAGYFNSPTGMGESARSMSRTLWAGNIACKEVPLASTQLMPQLDLGELLAGELLATYDPAHKINIIVANGDDYPHVRGRLPFSFFKSRQNIGYWVWETESLPETHVDTDGLVQIWTPSEYSADAIRRSVNIPVRVVPHILDFEEINSATANREKFGLPAEQLLFGFFFDCKSVVERKNPHAILDAFRIAFGSGTKDALLLLKVGSPEIAPLEIARLRRAAEDLNVVWITATLPREDVLCLMKSLDVYISLHRAEGFGLTLAEAMAMGKPVVASNYSGNVDFMTESDSCLVRTKVIRTTKRNGAYPAGTRWGEPDVEHAAEFLTALRDPAYRAAKGGAAAIAVRERLDGGRVGQLASGYLAAIMPTTEG